MFKRILCMFLSLVLFFPFSGCKNTLENNDIGNISEVVENSSDDVSSIDYTFFFTKNEKGNFVSPNGEEYVLIGNEMLGDRCLGELEFYAIVKDEKEYLDHLDGQFKTGFYSIKNDETKNILVGISPDSEWTSFYRKTSLPSFDFTVENCSRIEIVGTGNNISISSKHSSCNYGIRDKVQIKNFFIDIRSQKSPQDANLYELLNGEYCYLKAIILCHFDIEPNYVLTLNVWSYDDKAYSLDFTNESYVLPNDWYNRLITASNFEHE